MKPWLLAIVAMALLATAGCRSDPAIPLLERELRMKDDEIYRLRRSLSEMQDFSNCVDRRADEPAPSSEPRGNGRSRRDRHSDAPADMGAPSVELPGQPSSGVPSSLKGHDDPLPPPQKLPGGDRSSRRLDRPRGPESDDADGPSLQGPPRDVRSARVTKTGTSLPGVSFLPAGNSRRVAAIALNRSMTGGVGHDSAEGDQGVLVVVEPRDREGRSIDAPAEMSVVVVDPTLEGDAGRVARWDFTPAETATMFRRTGQSQAIHLVATWPNDPPTHGKLHLFVRYVTADGRRLQADQPIEVALASDRRMVRSRPDDARPASPEPAETAPRRDPEPPRRAPARVDDTASRRPVWSPDRR